ncbi:hypothetical protein QQF64_004407 [Cirrhinus molitorella]|uniref:Uncharacterized protein n=1 Tax=Cirrhinus molitorella TaxID=172907 RepID=A0ABR3MG29_9TELE
MRIRCAYGRDLPLYGISCGDESPRPLLNLSGGLKEGKKGPTERAAWGSGPSGLRPGFGSISWEAGVRIPPLPQRFNQGREPSNPVGERVCFRKREIGRSYLKAHWGGPFAPVKGPGKPGPRKGGGPSGQGAGLRLRLLGGRGFEPTAAKAVFWKALMRGWGPEGITGERAALNSTPNSAVLTFKALKFGDEGQKRAHGAGAWGSVAEWSKALDLGSSLFGGVGSNPTAASSDFNQGRGAPLSRLGAEVTGKPAPKKVAGAPGGSKGGRWIKGPALGGRGVRIPPLPRRSFGRLLRLLCPREVTGEATLRTHPNSAVLAF